MNLTKTTRICRYCGPTESITQELEVGPNLPQKSIRIICLNCLSDRSGGLIYRYEEN